MQSDISTLQTSSTLLAAKVDDGFKKMMDQFSILLARTTSGQQQTQAAPAVPLVSQGSPGQQPPAPNQSTSSQILVRRNSFSLSTQQ